MKPHRSTVSRFASAQVEPERSRALRDDHPALAEGRTIFPTTVIPSTESPRFLISGHNNPKLGKTVLKGPRAGWPIYQLSLEERATCPRSCLQWESCYGNAMPFARRHTPDERFERYLAAEIITLCRQHPEGLLVRLHALGDFYSVEYVYLWARMLAEFPQLHVFGYTARLIDDQDPASRRIAQAIQVLTEGAWERFAIRTSGGVAERSVTAVFEDAGDAGDWAIICPAQTKATEACATCGLCWASAARDKAIGFMLHGMKGRAPAAAVSPPAAPPAAPAPKPVAPAKRGPGRQGTKAETARRLVAETLDRLAPTHPCGLSAKDLMAATGLAYEQVTSACVALDRHKKAHWVPAPGTRAKALLPVGGPLPAPPPEFSPRQLAALEWLKAECAAQEGAGDGLVTFSPRVMARSAGVPLGSLGATLDGLVRKGAAELVQRGGGGRPPTYRLAPEHRPARRPLAELPKASPVVPVAPVAKAPTPAPAPQPVITPPAPVRGLSLDEIETPAPATGPKRLADRRANDCAFPLDDPGPNRMDQTMFCCEHVSPNSPYCPKHSLIVWPHGRPKRATARRTAA